MVYSTLNAEVVNRCIQVGSRCYTLLVMRASGSGAKWDEWEQGWGCPTIVGSHGDWLLYRRKILLANLPIAVLWPIGLTITIMTLEK